MSPQDEVRMLLDWIRADVPPPWECEDEDDDSEEDE